MKSGFFIFGITILSLSLAFVSCDDGKDKGCPYDHKCIYQQTVILGASCGRKSCAANSKAGANLKGGGCDCFGK